MRQIDLHTFVCFLTRKAMLNDAILNQPNKNKHSAVQLHYHLLSIIMQHKDGIAFFDAFSFNRKYIIYLIHSFFHKTAIR